MKKLIYFLIPLFLFIPKVYALDYTHTNKFAGINSTQSSGNFIDASSDVIGQAYYSVPKNLAYNYLVLTYCSSSDRVQPGFAPNIYVTDSVYHVDTKEYCDTNYGNVTGTVKMNFFTIKNWYYNEDQAYLDVSYTYFHNSDSQHSQAFQFLGLSSQSSQDVSIAILAYLKQQQTNQDYTTILNEIKNNQNDYKKELQDVNSSIQKTNDTLNDDNIDDNNTTGTLNNLSNNLPTNSVISDLLLLPVRLFQNVLNSVNGSCSTFNLGSLYGSNLTLPCINIENLIGSTLWSVIDILFCGMFILVIRKKFVDIFESLTELRNGGNAVE